MYECDVSSMRKKIKLSSDGADCGSKKQKPRLWWRLWWGMAESTFGENLASVVMKLFSHLIYFIMKCYKFCYFNGIFEDNFL
jgi:hypothetical protein